jgi:UDP-N-acetylglucosamine--N-acetylmuramyl-(pentapeptide) pyrophosphoryl-undecaprenol N-acetylglucosamine transferase
MTQAPARVLLAGGGTAGHVEPALAVADALVRRGLDPAPVLLGTADGLEARLVPARGHRLVTIPRAPFPRRPNRAAAAFPGLITAAVRASGQVLDATGADVVVGFGGYVAMPAYLAARRRGTAIVIHEANVRPGLANRVGARWAADVLTGFPDTPLPRAVTIGLPLRTSLTSLDRGALREEAMQFFGLDPARVTILAFGGSQGASSLNRVLPAVAEDVHAAGGQILLATGHGRGAEAGPIRDGLVVVDYLERMDLAYAAADLAVVRAGAMTIAELTALGLPAIYVPLPIGNGEQGLNAAPVVAAGGGLVIDDAALSRDTLLTAVRPVLADPAALGRMGAAAAAFGRTDADDRVVDVIERLLTKGMTR